MILLSALLWADICQNRTTCRHIITNDNLALSVVMAICETVADIIAQNPKDTVSQTQRRLSVRRLWLALTSGDRLPPRMLTRFRCAKV